MNTVSDSDIIHVKAKFIDDKGSSEYKKFDFDQKNTDYNLLLSLINKCFDIEKVRINVFFLLTTNSESNFFPLKSDYDLRNAILKASFPNLVLKVEQCLFQFSTALSPVHKALDVNKNDPNLSDQLGSKAGQVLKIFTDFIKNHRLDDKDTLYQLIKPPLNENELKNYFDSSNRLVHMDKLKRSVFEGGIEPHLRKTVWLFILNVFPPDTSGEEQEALLISKSHQYDNMRQSWRNAYHSNKLTETQMSLLALISLDVIRTDNCLGFYSMDSNLKNVQMLFNVIATYSIYHPSVGYHQGMSDMASPILFVMKNEARTYIAFCALMQRLHKNFTQNDQITLITKMQHLHDLIVYSEPQFARFLREHSLANMYFTQRWLLLDLKREFDFDEALTVLETQWATLPIRAPECMSSFSKSHNSNSKSCGSYLTLSEEVYLNFDKTRAPEQTNVFCYAVRDLSLINTLVGHEYVFTNPTNPRQSLSIQPEELSALVKSDSQQFSDFDDYVFVTSNDIDSQAHDSISTENGNSEEPLLEAHSLDYSHTSIAEEVFPNEMLNKKSNGTEEKNCRSKYYKRKNRPNSELLDSDPIQMKDCVVELPPPDQMGAGHPFLMFLCLSLLQEYRQELMQIVQDAADLIHFYQDRKKKHNALTILNRARRAFDRYMRDQETKAKRLYPELNI